MGGELLGELGSENVNSGAVLSSHSTIIMCLSCCSQLLSTVVFVDTLFSTTVETVSCEVQELLCTDISYGYHLNLMFVALVMGVAGYTFFCLFFVVVFFSFSFFLFLCFFNTVECGLRRVL